MLTPSPGRARSLSPTMHQSGHFMSLLSRLRPLQLYLHIKTSCHGQRVTSNDVAMLHNDRLAWCGHQPVEGLQQNLEGALVREWQLAQHNGAARRALLSRLDEVRQQPALCIERVFHEEFNESLMIEWQGACSKVACNCTGRKHVRLWGPPEVLLRHVVVLSSHSTSHKTKS